MNFKTSLDKYITRHNAEDDNFQLFCEQVDEVITTDVYTNNEEFFTEPTGMYNQLLNRYCKEGYKPIDAYILITQYIYRTY